MAAGLSAGLGASASSALDAQSSADMTARQGGSRGLLLGVAAIVVLGAALGELFRRRRS
jgi:hypothetical protein